MEKNTSCPPYPPAVTLPFLTNSFTTISYRIVYSVLYLQWFLLILRLYNFISGNNSNSKEILLIESVYHGLGQHLLKIPSPLILISTLGSRYHCYHHCTGSKGYTQLLWLY